MQPSQQGTIRTYLDLAREHRVLLVAMALLTAAAALIFSLSQEPRYTARASLQFQDQSQDLARAGVSSALAVTAEELAAKGAETLLEAEVLDAARRRLKLKRSNASLRNDLATTVDEKSKLVTVQATAGSAKLAAALANTVAEAAVRTQTRAERSRYRRAADRVARQLKALRKRGPGQAAAEVAFFDRLAALQTLSVNATPVTVTSRASVPSAASSPKPLRNTILGLLVGLLVGGALAILREALDTRLRDGADVQRELEFPVVAMVREEAFALTPFVEAGNGAMDDQDVEAFRILKANLQFIDVDEQVRTIAVTSPLPEEGKSTVASSLALASEASGTRTLLVECDLRRPSLASRLGANEEPGLTDRVAGAATTAEATQSIAYSKAAPRTEDNGGRRLVREWQEREHGRLAFVSAGTGAPLPTEILASQRFRGFLEEARSEFEMVVIDTPPLLSVADTREVLPLVDGILMCVRVDRTTRDQALAAKAALERLPRKPTGVVVTGLKRSRASHYGYYAHAYEQYAGRQASG